MEALTAADLLDVWERGSGLEPPGRALLLLGRARPDLPAADLGAVPIGRRDGELLRLRRALFGDRMAAVVSCPGCAEPLELDIDVDRIAPPEPLEPLEPGEAPAGEPPGRVRVMVGDRAVTARVPGTDDVVAALAAVAGAGSGDPDPSAIRRALLARLVDGEAGAGAADDGGPAADDLEAALGAAILEADPGAEIRLALSCVCCGHHWETELDIASYLWTEVAHAARRVAAEIAGLAAAYGWREADALALSPWRRRLYLALAAE